MLVACGSGSGTPGSGSGSSGPSTGPGSTSAASASTSSSTVSSTGPTTSAGSGTGGDAAECHQDADCLLFTDCCSCDAIPADSMPGFCNAECIQTVCEAAGIDAVWCNLGSCRLGPVSCDATIVSCEQVEPQCPAGMLPSVAASCWGPCVPTDACDFVPDCSYCGGDRLCVAFGGIASGFTCSPVPPGCIGDPAQCLCDAICGDALSTCSTSDDGITCIRSGG